MKATPALTLAGTKRDGGEVARAGSAGDGQASARWDALRRRVRAREEEAARKATAAECGGEVVDGRKGTVAMGPGTCGRAPDAACIGLQHEVEGVVGMVVAMPSGGDGGVCMQLD